MTLGVHLSGPLGYLSHPFFFQVSISLALVLLSTVQVQLPDQFPSPVPPQLPRFPHPLLPKHLHRQTCPRCAVQRALVVTVDMHMHTITIYKSIGDHLML